MSREDVEAHVLFGLGAVEGAYKYFIKPELTGKRAWMAVAGLVTAYELICPDGELLSEECDRAINKYPTLTRAAIGYTALHLMNMLPQSLDVYHQAHKRMRKKE
jgi:hypothetical protein